MREGVKPVEVGEDREEGREREARSADKVVRPCEGCERASDARTHQQQSMGDGDGDDGICLREKTFLFPTKVSDWEDEDGRRVILIWKWGECEDALPPPPPRTAKREEHCHCIASVGTPPRVTTAPRVAPP